MVYVVEARFSFLLFLSESPNLRAATVDWEEEGHPKRMWPLDWNANHSILKRGSSKFWGCRIKMYTYRKYRHSGSFLAIVTSRGHHLSHSTINHDCFCSGQWDLKASTELLLEHSSALCEWGESVNLLERPQSESIHLTKRTVAISCNPNLP